MEVKSWLICNNCYDADAVILFRLFEKANTMTMNISLSTRLIGELNRS